MTYIDWQQSMTPTRKTWLSKLASAFKKPSKTEHAPMNITQKDQSVYGRLPFIDTRPPTTGSVQLGVPLQQDDCLLLTLPVEIRQTIYKFVYGPSLIHVGSLGHRLAHVRCEKWELDGSWDGHAHWQDQVLGGLGETGIVGVNNIDDPNDQLVSLCLTCRRIYKEALHFMLSIPLYTVCDAPYIFVKDNPRLGTFIHIRNLSMGMYFWTFPQFMWPPIEPYTVSGWKQICNTLASMTSLRYLCIFIMQGSFAEYFQRHTQQENIDIVAELLRPLRSVKIPEGGVFDVIAQGWRVPDGAVVDSPFRVIQERPPPVADLMNRTHELGEFSQDSYVELASMPWPLPYRPYRHPNHGLPPRAVT